MSVKSQSIYFQVFPVAFTELAKGESDNRVCPISEKSEAEAIVEDPTKDLRESE